ncbi:MAG: AmmeMemoRadiSam system protein A [Candidatus Hydrogenedentes bacterium]|nr:AmmeMemoRadiSam system protein A [Candidatus Hydrogenedentota bacterium]
MPVPDNTLLSEEEQHLLLRIAQESLAEYAQKNHRINIEDYPLTPRLRRKCGAFVTLHKNKKLRGCIGYTNSAVPIAQVISENAINAGFNDSRFSPVQPEELADIQIEISALLPGEKEGSPFIKVNDITEINIGQDGLYLEHSGVHGAGLLLPQVPVEQGWDIDAYLKGICMKAGAPMGAWNEPASKLYRFRAQVFG